MPRPARRTCRSTSSLRRSRPRALDKQAEAASAAGQRSGGVADEYVRITVILAAVLFLIGIGTTFMGRQIRYGIAGVSTVLLGVRPRPDRPATVAALTASPTADDAPAAGGGCDGRVGPGPSTRAAAPKET